MRLLLDEMLPPRLADELRTRGIDVMAISESVTLRGTQDPDVLEMAAREGQVLLTDNIKDFAALDAIWAARGRSHAGILYISTRTYPQNRARIGALVAVLEARYRQSRWPEPGQCQFL
jgi:predicted nuclease of predicted toxin-antitoxin system